MPPPQHSFKSALNDRVISIISLLITLTFVFLYIIGSHRHFKKPNAGKKWNYILHISSIISLILFNIHSIFICLNNWSVFPEEYECDIIQKLIFSIYHSAKGFMYFVLVTRLRVIFQDSIFAYPKILINLLSIFVIISMYGLIIADILFIYGSLQIYPWKRCIRIQTNKINIILCKLFLILDAFLSLLCLFLFIFKIKQCLRTIQKEFNHKLVYIMIKYSVLSIISIISTSIFIIFFTFIDISSSYSLSFDGMINSFCLLVMAKFYDNIYNGCPICYYLHHSINKFCINSSKQQQKQPIKNMKIKNIEMT